MPDPFHEKNHRDFTPDFLEDDSSCCVYFGVEGKHTICTVRKEMSWPSNECVKEYCIGPNCGKDCARFHWAQHNTIGDIIKDKNEL